MISRKPKHLLLPLTHEILCVIILECSSNLNVRAVIVIIEDRSSDHHLITKCIYTISNQTLSTTTTASVVEWLVVL
jgi:hypothetical protein